MEVALRAQDMIERLERRRSSRAYGWDGARRRFNVWLADQGLGLSGKLDVLLERSGEAAVVDFKLTSGEPGDNHRMQLTGYALLVEAVFGLSVRQGFLYRIPDDRIFSIDPDGCLRERVRDAVQEIRRVENTQWFPKATEVRARCRDCEYQNFCADIW
jgi:CRISPR-associated exonuclease Cas4